MYVSHGQRKRLLAMTDRSLFSLKRTHMTL
jgi:hypothetical protein